MTCDVISYSFEFGVEVSSDESGYIFHPRYERRPHLLEPFRYNPDDLHGQLIVGNDVPLMLGNAAYFGQHRFFLLDHFVQFQHHVAGQFMTKLWEIGQHF